MIPVIAEAARRREALELQRRAELAVQVRQVADVTSATTGAALSLFLLAFFGSTSLVLTSRSNHLPEHLRPGHPVDVDAASNGPHRPTLDYLSEILAVLSPIVAGLVGGPMLELLGSI